MQLLYLKLIKLFNAALLAAIKNWAITITVLLAVGGVAAAANYHKPHSGASPAETAAKTPGAAGNATQGSWGTSANSGGSSKATTTQKSSTGSSNGSSSGSGGSTSTAPGQNNPPPSGSVCTLIDTSGCDSSAGKIISFNNVTAEQGNTGFIFQCTGSLANYTDPRAVINGSGWPVHLNINFTAGVYNYGSGQPVSAGTIANLSAISLGDGCTGDGNSSTIDLIVHVQGDGRTYGVQGDVFKLNGSNAGPSGIQLTTSGGSINCGPRQGAASHFLHQDAIQIQNGDGVGFYGVTIGDWQNQRATCWGAGGAFFLSAANGHTGKNLTLNHLKAVTCNHGLNGDSGGLSTSGSVTDSVFRTGRPSDKTDILASIDSDTGTNTIGLCNVSSAPVSANTLGLSGWTFINTIGDAWSQSGQVWSPGFNPAYNAGL